MLMVVVVCLRDDAILAVITVDECDDADDRIVDIQCVYDECCVWCVLSCVMRLSDVVHVEGVRGVRGDDMKSEEMRERVRIQD